MMVRMNRRKLIFSFFISCNVDTQHIKVWFKLFCNNNNNNKKFNKCRTLCFYLYFYLFFSSSILFIILNPFSIIFDNYTVKLQNTLLFFQSHCVNKNSSSSFGVCSSFDVLLIDFEWYTSVRPNGVYRVQYDPYIVQVTQCHFRTWSCSLNEHVNMLRHPFLEFKRKI